MEGDIYFESVNISYKTVNIFEEMYGTKKKEIINDLKKILKEKYNININESERKHISTTFSKTVGVFTIKNR